MLDILIKTLEISDSIEFRAPGTIVKVNVGVIKVMNKDNHTDITITAKAGHWMHLFRYEEVESWVFIPNKKKTIVNIKDMNFGGKI